MIFDTEVDGINAQHSMRYELMARVLATLILLPFESTFVFWAVKIRVFWGNFGFFFLQNREFNAFK